MTKDDEKRKALPRVSLGTGDIRVIDDILRGSISYLRNTVLTPQTIRRIEELEGIRERLLFLRGGDGNVAIVTTDDIRAIREAMMTFVKMTRQIVPQSPERDETLRLVRQLRKHLEESFLS